MYEKLDSSVRSIRILTLLPSTLANDPVADIRCELEVVQLDTDKREPYHALSYAWGNPDITSPIEVNGETIQVNANLVSALLHLRGENKSTCLWSDAVCINQSDNIEKGSQVAMMKDIYRGAACVVVWLGEETEDSKLAMKTVTEWGAPELREERFLLDTILKNGFGNMSKKWDALNNLFSRPYWHRRWIFQEILLGRQVEVHCGKDVVDWDNFKGLEEAWYQTLRKVDWALPITPKQQDIIKESGIKVMQTFTSFDDKNKWKRPTQSMTKLMQGTTSLQCSDPRDHIYAVMGLAKDAEKFPAPDYNKTVEQTYIDFAKADIGISGSLDIIGEAILRAHGRHDDSSLPSWVPDWRTQPSGRPLHRTPSIYNAAKDCKIDLVEAKIVASMKGDIPSLNVQGVVIDTIAAVYDDEETNSIAMMLWVLIHGITTGEDPEHPSGYPFLNVLFKTLLLDHDYRLRGEAVSLTTEESSSPDIFFQIAGAFLLLVSIQWGYLRDIVFPGEDPDQALFDLDLRFLKEGSELARRYPKLETLKTFRDAVRSEGPKSQTLQLTIPIMATVREAITKFMTEGRVLMETKMFLFGLATEVAQVGDTIAVLQGYNAPVILRQDEGGWKLVGDAFVYGIMNGEAFDNDDRRINMDMLAPEELIIH